MLFNLIQVVFRVGLRFTEDKVTCNNSIPFCKIDYSVTVEFGFKFYPFLEICSNFYTTATIGIAFSYFDGVCVCCVRVFRDCR